ncbi:MAG: PhoH family protein [Richelia sp. RM2_1_2]|nr:PhoH family protein [Richelia sp. RM2_1_2]
MNNANLAHKVYQKESIKYKLNIREPKFTEKQKKLIEIIKNKNSKVNFVRGPSGTSKTFLAVYCALELLNTGRIKEIILIRSIAESSSLQMGHLPGNTHEKLEPFMCPFYDKFKELINVQEFEKLKAEERIVILPVNYLRGRQFNAAFMIFDEAQNATLEEIQTVITRIGKYSKLIIAGDTDQVDFARGKKIDSSFEHFYHWYDNNLAIDKGIYCFKFNSEDVMRDEVVAYFIEEYKKIKATLSIKAEEEKQKKIPVQNYIELMQQDWHPNDKK